MASKDIRRLVERWDEGVRLYRAGVHPNQDKITAALERYIRFVKDLEEAEG